MHSAAESTRAAACLVVSAAADRMPRSEPESRGRGATAVMTSENRKRMIRASIRIVLVVAALACFAPSFVSRAFAASPGGIDLGSITVSPERLSAGQQPNIEVRVKQTSGVPGSSVTVNIIATVTKPDHRGRTWRWGKVTLKRDAVRTITIPKELDTSADGTYRVEFLVYSDDMKRRLARRSSTFEVIAPRQAEKPGKKKPSEAQEGIKMREEERAYMGLGLYGNALNPAGGGVVLLWPSKYVGLEGIYSVGEFTSYEGRLIARVRLSDVYGLYGGIGYIHVTTDKDVLGVATRFSDSGMSGAVGVEAALGQKVRLYVELSTARIELEQTVTSGAQTVKASVEYAPVTIGIGVVLMVF